jgi:hypothetical protein
MFIKEEHAQHNTQLKLTLCHLSVFNYSWPRPQPPKTHTNNGVPAFSQEGKYYPKNKHIQGLYVGFLLREISHHSLQQ